MCLTGGSLVSAMGENEVISREARALGERNVVGKSKSIKVGHKSRDNHIIYPKYDFQISFKTTSSNVRLQLHNGNLKVHTQ